MKNHERGIWVFYYPSISYLLGQEAGVQAKSPFETQAT
jgi:hypothetical protein